MRWLGNEQLHNQQPDPWPSRLADIPVTSNGACATGRLHLITLVILMVYPGVIYKWRKYLHSPSFAVVTSMP